MTSQQTMKCLLVTKNDDGRIERRIEQRSIDELPAGDVLVRVRYSSLNYKDALAASGHPGVARAFPHVPGIDAAGVVVESNSDRAAAGQEVVVTSFDLGAGRWGGYAQFVRVPGEWVVPLPAGLSLRESMGLGTAGLTAAMCLETIERHEPASNDGEVLVTGASGGVGTMAVAMFAQAGYRVAAASGKPSAGALLKRLGAGEIVPREAVVDASSKPLLKPRWAAAIDTVGGRTLATILRTTRPRGIVTACGLVGGAEFDATVYPFILRGITLAGIDSAWHPASLRKALWDKMSGPWKPRLLDELVAEVAIDDLPPKIDEILAGRVTGRIVVRIDDS